LSDLARCENGVSVRDEMEDIAKELLKRIIAWDYNQGVRSIHGKIVKDIYIKMFPCIAIDELVDAIMEHNYEVLDEVVMIDLEYKLSFGYTEYIDEWPDDEQYQTLYEYWAEDMWYGYDMSGYLMSLLDEYNLPYIQRFFGNYGNREYWLYNDCQTMLLNRYGSSDGTLIDREDGGSYGKY